MKKTEDEISSIAKIVADGYEDEELKTTFVELAVQLYVPRSTCGLRMTDGF